MKLGELRTLLDDMDLDPETEVLAGTFDESRRITGVWTRPTGSSYQVVFATPNVRRRS